PQLRCPTAEERITNVAEHIRTAIPSSAKLSASPPPLLITTANFGRRAGPEPPEPRSKPVTTVQSEEPLTGLEIDEYEPYVESGMNASPPSIRPPSKNHDVQVQVAPR
ncbi:unnamed protein product, partial [Gongylonema pulchrum]|uniref:Polyprotein n=1 Tax=Gongylonema pulchrum TaxID=637853 RepID=A0A183DED4_9BILA